MPFYRGDGFWDVDSLAVQNRFAAVQAFHHRQFSAVVGDQFAKAYQHILARARVERCPMALVKSSARFGHGQIYVTGITAGNFCQYRACGGINRCKLWTASSAILAVNKGGARRREIGSEGFILRPC